MTNQQLDIFIIGMTVFLMIFMGLRSIQPNGGAYRKYAMYLFCMNVFFIQMYSMWYVFLPMGKLKNYIVHLAIISTLAQTIGYIFYFYFVSEFLNLKQKLPGVDTLFKYVRLACWIFALATLFIVYVLKNGWLANRSFEIVRMLLCIVSFYGMIKAYKLKDPLTNYFILGNGLYLTFALVCWGISIYDKDVLHYSLLQSILGGMQVAVLAESICFALGLSYKDTRLEKEKQVIQQELIHQLQISNRQQKEFADHLEEKVRKQTDALVNLEKEKFELEKLQAINQERGRIARDMHDDLGSGLSAIHLLSNYLKENTLEKYPDISHEIGKISSSSEDLNARIREIIWTTNTKDDSLQSLILFITKFVNEIQERTKINLHIDAPDPIPEILLTGDQRKQIFLTLKESLNNSLKHAKATSIGVNIKMLSLNYISIMVTDNGIGFNLAKLNSKFAGNGLENMKNRMEAIGGSVEIESNPTGTSVSLNFKA